MFNQFDQDEFDREFASASARIKQAQKEMEARKAQVDREFDEAEKRINARIEEHRKMHDESEQTHVHRHSGSCSANARMHQQFVDEMNRQQFADHVRSHLDFVNSMNMF